MELETLRKWIKVWFEVEKNKVKDGANFAMIIANPIYDVVFKYLMEDLDIAKGMIAAIINEKVEEIQFQAREQILERAKQDIHPHLVSLQRLDFVATIQTDDGERKKVLIELQKARLSSDVSRFRSYLGKRYQERDEVRENGVVVKKSLPIVAIYILGFDLEPSLPACIKVDRRYLNMITRRPIKTKNPFMESLSHDLYVIQAGKLDHKAKTDMERVLGIFGQTDFNDDTCHDITLPDRYAGKNDLIKRIMRRLTRLREEEKVRENMDFEDSIYEEFEAGLRERTSSLTQKLRFTAEELEAAQKEKEAAQKREEAAQKREEAAQKREEALMETAISALTATGISRDEAKKALGLE